MIITIVGTQFLSRQANQPTELLYDYLLLTTLLSSAAVFLFFKTRFTNLTLSPKTIQRIQRCSKLTFGMYLFHDFVNMFFRYALNLTSTSFDPILAVPVITMLVFALSYAASWILNRIPILNKYIV